MPRRQNARGQAVLEFALVLPILVLIVVGIADVSLAFFRLTSLSAAAREGVRWGIIRQCDDPTGANPNSIQYRAVQAAPGSGITPGLVSISYPDGGAAAGDRIQVSVSTVYRPMNPVIDGFVVALTGGTITLTQRAQMLIETANASCS